MAGPLAQRFEAQPLASAGGRVITSPFQFITTGEDHLRIVSFNSAAGVRLKIRGRVVPVNGPLEPLERDHVPNTDRTAATSTIPLQAGAVLNLTVFASSGAPLVGQTYVMVHLIRGLGSAAIVLGTLLAGYVTAQQHLAWPGSPIVSSTAGEPAARVITGTTPAVGGELLETVPSGARWEVLSMWFQLTTAGGGLNRRVTIKVDNGVSVFCQVLAFNVSAPLTLWTHCWGPGVEGSSDATLLLQQAGIPDRIIMPSGGRFFTSTANLAAGDQFSGLVYLVREWLEVD